MTILRVMLNSDQPRPMAFLDKKFMESPEARGLRILSEYNYPDTVFKKENVQDTIVFFGSARSKSGKQLRKELSKYKNQKPSAKEQKKIEAMKLLTRYDRDASLLAYKMTKWSKNLKDHKHRFLVCSGGGPGMMEAANRGASLAKGKSLGLNISLPFEQAPNKYITNSLSLDFHYFFMRKYWFMYLAKAMVIFPGGFGTCDEFFEVLTLVQTGKIKKPVPLVLYGKKFWNDTINFEKFADWGVINEDDLKLFYFADSVDEAYEYLVEHLTNFVLDKDTSDVR